MTQRRSIVLAPRNDPLGFARRTRKNLENIERAYSVGADVHVVTQLMLSLLGLIVFPMEKEFYQQIRHWRLEELEKQGWPKWEMSLDKSENLGDLMYHLRNAVAHRHVTFSSDSRDINEVSIEFTDHRLRIPAPYWRAHI